MYFPECFAMNAGISATYFLKPAKSFTEKSSTKYAFIPYHERVVGEVFAVGEGDDAQEFPAPCNEMTQIPWTGPSLTMMRQSCNRCAFDPWPEAAITTIAEAPPRSSPRRRP